MTSNISDPDNLGDAGTGNQFGDFSGSSGMGELPAGTGELPAGMGELPAGMAGQFSGSHEDPQEVELNRAIEELRGVLHEDKAKKMEGSSVASSSSTANADIIMNIPVEVQIVLGSTRMSVSELMALRQGSTVSLDRRIGEPVDIVVNGRKIACGEITVLENDPSRFGIRLTQIIDAAKSA